MGANNIGCKRRHPSPWTKVASKSEIIVKQYLLIAVNLILLIYNHLFDECSQASFANTVDYN